MFKKILSGSIWGIVSKVADAAAKFVTIPLLVTHYGRSDYGLIALVISLNAYMSLMDLGMNIGSVRFFSIWLSNEDLGKVAKASRSSVFFYGLIGLVNAAIFVVIALFPEFFFKLENSQIGLFQQMMYIMAITSIVNWVANVVSQLLTASGEVGWINRVIFVSSLLNFVTAVVAVKLNFSLSFYFLLYTLSTIAVIPLNILRLRIIKLPLKALLFPEWDSIISKEILGYGLAILAMGVFQFSANNLRPLILNNYSNNGIEALTDYRVLQTISMLVLSMGAIFRQVLLPSASRIHAQSDYVMLNRLVFDGIKYISVFLCFLVFIIIANSKTFLTLYMGSEYTRLFSWLVIWLITVLITLHKAPLDTIVLSTGKTKFIVYISAISCFITLPITALLAPRYEVGAAVIGYFFYILIEVGGFYIYYVPKILKLNSYQILRHSFLPSLLIGLMAWLVSHLIAQTFQHSQGYLSLILNCIVFSVVYISLTLMTSIRPKEIKMLFMKMRPAS